MCSLWITIVVEHPCPTLEVGVGAHRQRGSCVWGFRNEVSQVP